MKKIILSSLMAGALVLTANAQEFNKWSLEATGGFNKPMAPLTGGFLSPTLNIGHVDFGVRYMFNEKFGAKLDYGFGSFKEVDGESPSFDTKYNRLNLQGVANIGRIMNFESFSRSFGLLLHGGAGIGMVNPEENVFNDFNDKVYTLIFGLTPQVKLSERVALVADISTILNGRQTVTFDGATAIRPDISNGFYGANGTWWTGTIGLNFYLGKATQHADWYIAADKYATKEELATQINGIKDMLKDSDGDGVPDYLDKEPNTPAGARVNSSGMTLDSDGDGTPDHLDKCPFQPGPASTNGCPAEVEVVAEVDYLKKAINDGYVNVYFAFDSSKPLGYSISAAHFVSNFMKRNPSVNMEIKGFADEIGPEDYNMKLSETRAKAVYDLLISSGINASRLSFKGYGEDTSVDKASADARQMARRTSFEVK
ncbi:OmpA-OmpF porin, OOP family [Algoriphagus alkaliphilus]|uniref:OmpA-OmpF porin, OOP family n=1 Tax=Algoriphagus alkaliphilus TaxID=279824 RepID=A0A1G5XS44_9BACT|nr:OmpA family protein [Algoriphagus alkaliphilus]SDA72405.1 OmpA-OmpF porin, OOP family [Algoriphagus alkaliphilus]